MARKPRSKPQYVVCLSNRGFKASLVVRRLYQALPDEAGAKQGLIRVVDESGEDYLYPARMFAAIDVPQVVEKAFRKAG